MRFLILLACHTTEKTSEWVDTATIAAPQTVAPPAWDATEVQSRIQNILSAGLPDAPLALSGYQQMFLDGADPWDNSGTGHSCPNAGNYSMIETFSGCLSQKGYIFAGVSVFTPSTDGSASFFLLGDCYITDPEGNTFYCGGEIEYNENRSSKTFDARLTGTWGSVAAEGWLSTAPSLALWERSDGSSFSVDGGYTPGDDSLYFDQATTTAACANSGSIWLRDPGGSWYILDYGEDCDSCGALSYAGSPLGEACADFGAAGLVLMQRLGFQ